MSAIIVTLLNEKGGVGKTTTVAAIACLLAYMGYNVCAIDTDRQGHLAIRLKMETEDGFYTLMGGAEWKAVLRPISPAYYGAKPEDGHRLWLVPGAAATYTLDSSLNAHALIARLEQIRPTFDFILFDTSPSIGAIHAALFAASDFILIPTECTHLSVRGLISTMQHIKVAALKAQDAGLEVAKIMGILPTKFDGSRSVHYESRGWLAGKYGDELIFPSIRLLTDWEKAESLQMPIHLYKPRSAAAAETRALVRHLLAVVEREAHA